MNDAPLLPLRRIRKERNLSQETVATFLNIKTTTYSKIERGIIQITLSRLYELAEVFRLSPYELLSYEDADTLSTAVDISNITYVPVHAQAGFLDHFVDQRTPPEGISFSIPTFSEKDLYMISVEGDSMYPTLIPGAYIIIKEVKDHYLLQWGEPHLIVTTDGRVVKRVLKHSDASLLTLYSDNDLYQPYEIQRESILSLWKVIGMVSKSFTPQRSSPSRYPN
ncbi:XRE family transcriptional regulator [Tunicatimonas pelagia]|uniref:XRE family transcriptional regulator n=1 Tax=Tunicatimonas pelagia TaxID=931531 RepID=UPI0026669DFE|nr:LexA family transcriptional regulator [Tunicatimonas pelagia]WKN44630.1 LexA family transcriptional regulator [Tunicatimonas pelagia]